MRSKKKTASITAGVLAAAILLTGTFAWRSISQQAKNEIIHTVNPGGRLHDDFDGESKDVYVENFMKKGEGGQAIFARVRLDEYMETGENAGDTTNRADITVLAKSAKNDTEDAKIDDVTTWKTHIPGDTDDPFHKYWEWTTGGETVFMPTFNKNKDSLSADVNGTWEGKVQGDYDHFDDYVEYTDGQKLEGMAYYDVDDNDVDEYDPLNPAGHVPGAGGTKGTNYRESKETHTAKKTGNATVMTMKDWIDAGRPMGPIWVYDVDGWAYWAQAIEPGEATGLLLDGIEYISDDETPCYYGINVVAQFATKDECALPEGTTSGDPCDYIFDEAGLTDKPSDDAKLLLKQAMGVDYDVTVAAAGSATEVAPGGTLDFKATLKIGSDELEGDAAAVTWSVTGAKSKDTKIDADGKLTVGADEAADTVLTVQAKTWNREIGTATVTVKEGATPAAPGGGTSDVGGEEPGVMTDPVEDEPGVMDDDPAENVPAAGDPLADTVVDEPVVGEPTADEPVDPPVEAEPAPVTAPESGLAPEPAAE